MKTRTFVSIILLGLIFCPTVVAEALPGQELVKAKLLADTSAIRPGQPFHIGVMFKIAPGWHLYWSNPGDGGIPTTLDLNLPPGFTASASQYPTPQRFDQTGGLIAYGYENEAMIVATITPPAHIDSTTVPITAEANWLVCEKTCVPGDAKISLTMPVSNDAQANEAETFKRWVARMPVAIDKSDRVTRHQVQANDKKLTITIDWSNQPPANIQWFPPASQALNFRNIKVDTKEKTTTITADIDPLAGQKVEENLPDSVIGYSTGSDRAGLSLPVKAAFKGS
jgi:DsbC/DsbD-like thiol-disulfide interchange protein